MSQAASLQAPPEAATPAVAVDAPIAVAAIAAGTGAIEQAPAVVPAVAPVTDPSLAAANAPIVAIGTGPAEAAPAAEPTVAIGTGAIAAPVPVDASAATDGAAKIATRVEAPPAAIGTRTAVAHVGTPAPMPHAPSPAGSIGGALFALVLVVGLILVLGWLAKRMPGLGGTRGNPALRLVGSLALGPRDRVVVVEVGGTQLLLGVGSGGTRTLHTLAEPLPVAPPSKAAPAFAQLLAQHFGKKP